MVFIFSFYCVPNVCLFNDNMARHTVNNKDVTILWCTLEVSVPLCNEKLYSVSLSCDILYDVIREDLYLVLVNTQKFLIKYSIMSMVWIICIISLHFIFWANRQGNYRWQVKLYGQQIVWIIKVTRRWSLIMPRCKRCRSRCS